jgi:hypothetical protein
VITATHSEDFKALKTLVYKMCYEIVHVQQVKQAHMYEGTNKKEMHSTTADIHCIIKSATCIGLEILGVYSMIPDCGHADRNMLDR